MKRYLVLLSFWWSMPAFGFAMVSPTGMDMQSAALMQSCQEKAEGSALLTDTRNNTHTCSTALSSVHSNSTKLTGLSLEKKGFVYEVNVDTGCQRTIKYEVEVGPSNDGSRCLLLSTPKILGVMESSLKD